MLGVMRAASLDDSGFTMWLGGGAVGGNPPTFDKAAEVVFHGFVTDTDSIYEQIDVSVVPSIRPEEFSLVAAEGQARGCATIVTGPGGVAEVVIDGITGLVVPPSDPEALAAALVSLDDDRALLEKLARAGADRIRERFSEDVYQRRIGELLDEVMGSTR